MIVKTGVTGSLSNPELACWTARLILLSPLHRFTSISFLHPMTSKEKTRLAAAAQNVEPHVPRNLGADWLPRKRWTTHRGPGWTSLYPSIALPLVWT